MTAKQIAGLIPAEYRREMLETNAISSAMASGGDPTMQYLAVIWKKYIDPNEKLDCSLCLERILRNLRELQPLLVELERESRLLDEV